ncbi:TonB-dependent receptor domain-containing protein, partial [Chryseobacterium sp. CH1]|uniref:TonB-dependent receptor domain-containing protein n=1 Tax=Chryseobacterium sp. CH1 TaxID=713551 RepID=UPI00100B4961
MDQKYTGLYLQDELGFFNDALRLTLAARYTNVKEVNYGTKSEANRITPRIGLSYSID